jgi:hypothetical protein
MNSRKRQREWTTLKKYELIDECKKRRWKGYSKYNKAGLLAFVYNKNATEEQAALTVNRAVSKWFRGRKHRLEIMNTEDIFTMEPIASGHEFLVRSIHQNFKVFQFDVGNLMRYVLLEGKFINPFNRDDLTDYDLMRLQKKFFKCFPCGKQMEYTLGNVTYPLSRHSDLVQVRKQITQQRHDERERERLGLYLEEQCNDIFALITCMIVEFPCVDIDIVSYVLIYIMNFHLPHFFDSFISLIAIATAQARTCLSICILKLAVRICKYSATDIRRDMFLFVFNVMDKKFRTVFNSVLVSPILDQVRTTRSRVRVRRVVR